MVMRVALETGLRVGDVLALRPPVKAQFWITEQKTGKRRRVNLRRERVEQLNRQSGRFWVFEGRTDPEKHRTRQAVWRDVTRAARAFRLPVNVTPHSARKRYAVEKLRQNRGKLAAVQKAMNHSDQSVTMLYAMADSLYNAKYEQGPDGRIRRRGRSKKAVERRENARERESRD